MTLFNRVVCYVVIVSLPIGPFGCATGSKKAGESAPPTSKAEALQREADKAIRVENDKRQAPDQLDQLLRVASMALDAGEPAYSREVLADVTELMTALTTDKDFGQREQKSLRTVGGKEHEKYFLGDPYEQMMAWLYLGILDFQAGHYDMARTSFRNASLADEGSSIEGYKSDCSLAMVLEGVSAARMGEDSLANDAFRFAARAFAFRQHMPAAQRSLYDAVAAIQSEDQSPKALERLDVAVPVIFEQLPAALSANDDLIQGLKSAVESARAALEKPEKKSESARLLHACNDNKTDAVALLNTIGSKALENLNAEVLATVKQSKEQFDLVIAACKNPQTNTFIIQQFGQAPAKVRAGRYGQVIQYYSYPTPEQRVIDSLRRLDAPDAPLLAFMALPGESVDYQAVTRGGRQMDSVLEGRAQFRDSMNVVSGLAMSAVPVAIYAGALAASTLVTTTATTVTYTATSTGVTATTTTTTTTAPAGAAAAAPFIVAAVVALAVYKGTKMIADATHPEGDIRGWHEIPAQFLFMCAALEPGEYQMNSDCFDTLARPLPERSRQLSFTVRPEKPTLLLANGIWK